MEVCSSSSSTLGHQ
jgi:hypothetical protein